MSWQKAAVIVSSKNKYDSIFKAAVIVSSKKEIWFYISFNICKRTYRGNCKSNVQVNILCCYWKCVMDKKFLTQFKTYMVSVILEVNCDFSRNDNVLAKFYGFFYGHFLFCWVIFIIRDWLEFCIRVFGQPFWIGVLDFRIQTSNLGDKN